MQKVYVHIFSFNRAAQLHLLLDSIAAWDKQNQLEVTVQYGCSNALFEKGYTLLMDHFPAVQFIKETAYASPKLNNPLTGHAWFNLMFWLRHKRFKYASSDFRKIMVDSFKNVTARYSMFLTDDSLFFRELDISAEALSQLDKDPLSAYSLTLGKNIGGGKYREENSFISWDLTDNEHGDVWKYPFSVDGRIYQTKLLYQLIRKIVFTNPNTFEALLVVFNKFIKVFKKIYAPKESILIGFELNRVQQVYNNNDLGIDTAEINAYYLKGYRLAIDFEKEKINTFRPRINSIKLYQAEKVISLYGL